MAKQQNQFDSSEMAVISEAVKRSGEAADIKMKNFNWLMGAVVLALFIGFITMVVAVGTMIIDSFHFNSSTFREYSQKTETFNLLLEENKNNQEVIKQLLEELRVSKE